MFDKNLMKLPGMRAVMGALVLLALLQAASIIGQAIGLSRAICILWEGAGVAASFSGGSGVGALAGGATPLEAATPDIVLFAVCFIVLQLVRFAQDVMLDRFSLARAQTLRGEILERTFDSMSLLSQRVGSARVAQIANDGIDEVQSYLRVIPPKIVGIAAISLPLLVCVFAFDWVSGVILTVMFPVVVFYMMLLGRQARERSERQYAVYTRLTNHFMDTLRGLPVLKAFGASGVEADHVYDNSERVRHATMRTLRIAMLSGAVLDLCATFGVAAVAIMLAFRLMDGSLALYTGLVALIIAPEYFTPIRSFASDYHASLNGKNSLAAVLEMIFEESEESETSEGSEKAAEHGENDAARCGPAPRNTMPNNTMPCCIEFKDVSFHHDGGGGIEGISFSVGAGEKVGIVGKSGAGKSTLASLFAGFLAPDGGTVLVDGEPASLTADAWKRRVRYIPQNPYVFHATLADNIRFYAPTASREKVQEAASAVGLDALISELPEGLDTIVGEGGRGLSGGEAHRVALARVMLDDQARVLVFDEPTAHLDIETERDLKPAMLAVMEGRLVLFATHRLHWMANMDCVVTLEAGRVTDVVSDHTSASSPALSLVDSSVEREMAKGQSAAENYVYTASDSCGHVDVGSRDHANDGCHAFVDDSHDPVRDDAHASIDKAEAIKPNDTPGMPAWFKGYLIRYRRAVAVALAFGFLALACSALLMFTSGYLISATALAGTTLFSILVPVAFVQLFGFGRPLARYLERLTSHNWVLHTTSDLRLALYRAIDARTGDPALARATGEYLGLLSDDVAHLQNLYLRVVFPVCVAYLLALGATALFGVFSLPVALGVLLSFAIVTVLLPVACLFSTRAVAQRAKTRKADEYAQLTDDVYGAVDWVLSGRGRTALERHASDDVTIRALESKARLRQRALSLVAVVLLASVLCFVIVWAGGRFGTPGANVNWIAAFALGFFPLVESFAALPAAFSESTAHRDSLWRLDEYLAETLEVEPEGARGEPLWQSLFGGDASTINPFDEPTAHAEKDPFAHHSEIVPDASSSTSETYGEGGSFAYPSGTETSAFGLTSRENSERVRLDASSYATSRCIELDNVNYTYPGTSRPAIDSLSLSVDSGQSVAVLGRSGAGKSTLASLICGVLSPDCGTVCVGGKSASDTDGSDFSRIVGFVGQTPYLFNRTLRENLTLGVLKANDAQLRNVLLDVGLGEKLSSMDIGLNTVVGETGMGFSGGEAHRIAIARVLVANTPIVVVDEPFSALDPETERDLLDTLLRACAGRTLVVITHHLTHIERFDRVIFIEDGCLDLDGSPSELLTTNPRFRELVGFDQSR